MAQQASNLPREPSMEEILASIRRIIEDNEPPSKETAQPEDFERIEPAIGPAANDPARSEAFGRQVAADDTDADDTDAAGADEPAALDDQRGAIDVEALSTEIQTTLRGTMKTHWDDGFLQSLDRKAVSVAPEVMPEPVTAGPAALAETGAQFDVPSQGETKPAILSEQTGRQVAASFGELSEAFAASRRRSFDEIAEEMMRPMLQDWLDNNLPMLVEKLVREEIERVARGA